MRSSERRKSIVVLGVRFGMHWEEKRTYERRKGRDEEGKKTGAKNEGKETGVLK